MSERSYYRINERYSQLILDGLDETHVFDGVPELFKTLREKGFRLGVSTSTPPDDIKRALELTKLDTLFDETLGSTDEFSKGPHHIQHFAKLWNLQPSQIAMIGDDVTDVKLAQKAGAQSIWRVGTPDPELLRALGPTLVVDPITKLVDMVELEESAS